MEEGSQQSEVARLLKQYEQEYIAAKQGLNGLASGTSKHLFITKKMERLGQIHGTLQGIIGDKATQLIADQLAPLPDNLDQGEAYEKDSVAKN